MQIPTPCSILIRKVLLCLLTLNLFILTPVLANQNGKQKVTIIASGITIEGVFRLIEKQTGMRFMYSVDALNLNEKVNVNFNQQILDEVLSTLLNGKGIIWQYREGIISLKQQNVGNRNPKSELTLIDDNISGKVLDDNGKPIPGVTIMIKGTSIGTQTDEQGRFIIPNARKGATLVVTSIGYDKEEVAVTDSRFLTIKLNSSTGILDEAVVIAYGTSTKRNLVGNITIIKAAEIERSPVSNILMALQGRVPGLFINQNIGLSGGGVTTMIQGQNSLTQGNDPFYVIDGVPYASQLLPNYGSILGKSGINNAQSGNPLSFINPSDIESVSVLKDADATAIYGSRAANGAILITTKKGKADGLRADFSVQQGWQKVANKLNVLNSKQYLAMRHEALILDGLTPSRTDYDINGFWDTTRSTNWQKELIGGTAKYTNLNSSISGGTTSTRYLVSGTYHKETTVFPGEMADQKGALHINLNSVSNNQKFTFQFSGNYIVDENKIPNVDLTGPALSIAPTAPTLFNQDGTLNWMPNASGTSTFINPLSYLNKVYSNKTKNLISNLNLKYTLFEGLDLTTSFGYNNLQSNELIINPKSGVAPEKRVAYQSQGYFGDNSSSSWIIEPQLTYKKKFKANQLDLLLGTSIQQNNSNGKLMAGAGYNSDDIISDILSAAQVFVLSTIQTKYKYNAAFGRINYSLLNKYIFNLTMRRDGSSRFGPANRFHNFGSVAAGWIFSEEGVFKNHLKFISFGKLRVSYGTTGNDQIGDYTFFNRYIPIPVGVPYRESVGITPNGIFNPYLQWEETRKFSTGIDLGLLKDRIILNITHNINRSSNLLRTQALPWATGSNFVLINFPGTVQNTGWELTANSTNIRSDKFNWQTSVNLTIPQNKLIRYPDLANSSDAGVFFIGKSLSTARLFHFLGVDPITGQYQFADSKGKATLEPSYTNDMNTLVNTAPAFYGGLQNSFSYGQFELNFLLQFVKRNGVNNSIGSYLPGSRNSNQPVEVLGRWKEQGDKVNIQRFNSDGSLASSYYYAYSSDGVVKDASYIRLKNVEISWKMPILLVNKLRLKYFNIFIQGQNLLTFTNYIGLDPETVGSNALPPLKTLVVGGRIGL